MNTLSSLRHLIENLPVACIVWQRGVSVFSIAGANAAALATPRLRVAVESALPARDAVEACARSRSSVCIELGGDFRLTFVPVDSNTVAMYAEDVSARSGLRESDRRFSQMLANMQLLAVMLDREGRITYCNDFFLKVLGWRREELIGQNYFDLFLTGDDCSNAAKLFAKLDTQAETWNVERVVRSKAQGRRLIHWNNSVLRGPDGTAVGVASIGEDITEKRMAEQASYRWAEEFRTLSEAMPQLVWMTDASGSNIYCNPRWFEFTGMSPDECTGNGWNKAFHEDESDAAATAWLEAIRTESVFEAERRVRSASGEFTWMLVRAVPVRGEDGSIVRWVGTCTDIDRLKKLLESIRNSQTVIEEQAELIDHAQDAIFVSDLDHRILFWSKGAERNYGWSADQVLGRSFIGLMKIDPVRSSQAMRAVLEKGEWSGETAHMTSTGNTRTMDARWTLLRDGTGKPKSIMTINTDITERKIFEQQLLRAQRMDSIGTLAGGIAHDLNNTLAPIVLSIGMLRENILDPSVPQILDSVEASAERAAAMVRRLLSFARGVDGERANMNLGPMLLELEKIANEMFFKNIEVVCLVPDDLWVISGDRTQIHQVLLNLCLNARDAMPDGGTLTISGKNTETENGPCVMLQIDDTGHGMGPETIEKIFDPFFTTKDIGKGTGLGLTTCLGIVKSHGGLIRVFSKPRKGSSFQILLPALPEATETAAASRPVDMPRGHGETVLLIDDEQAVREITRQTLERFGYRVLSAEGGEQALEIYRAKQAEISVVITDMMMPGMDGAATIQELRALNPRVRIVAASGLYTASSSKNSADGVTDYFLPKPYSAETLLQTLKQTLAA